jgi:C_GCAxxG_C_C family probable redox protein
MDRSDAKNRASELFDSGFFCAESVLAAVAEYAGISSPLVPKMATGFCSGLSRTNNMCGAVTGGILALGMIYGRSMPSKAVEPTYEKVQEFLNLFQKQNGSLMCEGLTDCNLSTDEGREAFKEKGLKKRCSAFTGYAAGLVVDLIMVEKK